MKQYHHRELKQIFFDNLNPDFFVEAGAFRGANARKISRKFPSCKVFAIEANPHNYEKFKGNHEGTGVKYLHLAISDKVGETTFLLKLPRKNESVNHIRGNNSILKSAKSNRDYEEVTVQTTTLTRLLKMNGLKETDKVSLWIDVEGAQREVLKGCEEIFPNVDMIYIEVEDESFWEGQMLAPELIKYLNERGFELIGKDSQYGKQYNILFAKQESCVNSL